MCGGMIRYLSYDLDIRGLPSKVPNKIYENNNNDTYNTYSDSFNNEVVKRKR